MIARIGVRAVLLSAVVATIGCDRVTKHVARAALAGEPGRSYLADTIRLRSSTESANWLFSIDQSDMDALQEQDVPYGNNWDSADEAAAYGDGADQNRPWR